MTDHEKLLEKIKKLLTLAKSDNPNEAALALAKAQEYMLHHGVTADLLRRSDFGEIAVKSTQSVSKAKDWESALAVLVGKAFGCKVIFSPGHSAYTDYWARWKFVGAKTQLPLVEYTFEVLVRKLTKARHAYSLELSKRGFVRGKSMTAELDGFCKGWVCSIAVKVIAFVNPDDIQQIINQLVEEATKGRKAKLHNRGDSPWARLDGEEAAEGESLYRPVKEKDPQRMLS